MNKVKDENFKHSIYIALNCFYMAQSLPRTNKYYYIMNDNCLKELHLLANTFLLEDTLCRYYAVII